VCPACTRSCWLEAKHPDPEGEQLQLLCTRLKTLFPSLCLLRRSGLLGVCQAYGFRDVGVFFDWASLFQKDPELWTEAELVAEEKRTEDQRRAAELYRESRRPYTRADDQYLWAHKNEPVEQLAKALGRGPRSCVARLKRLRDPSTEGCEEEFSDAKVSEERWRAALAAWRRAKEERRKAIIEGDKMFKSALGTLDLWYAHSKTTVVLLTELPASYQNKEIRSYDSRGWTTYERCSAELCKTFRLQQAGWPLVIDLMSPDCLPHQSDCLPHQSDCLPHQAGWPLVIDLGEQRAALRRLPTTPERMEELMEKCSFTNGADEKMVLDKYKNTARAVLGGIKELSFFGIPFDPEDPWRSPERLGQALNFCVNLKKLDLNFTGLTEKHLASISGFLSKGALPQLEQLFLGFNHLGPRGIEALGSALVSGVAPGLKVLLLTANDFGDAGLQSFATFIANGMAPKLKMVELSGNNFGDAGAFALTDALRQRLASGECKLGINFLSVGNHVGGRGRLALSAAIEASNKEPDLVKFMLCNAANALYPRNFKVVCVRTFKREMYSYLHAEYRHARGKRDPSMQPQEDPRGDLTSAHAQDLEAASC
jgi:hypothetical protein